MELELWQLNNIIKAAAKEAVRQFQIQQNPESDEIKEREAFREFGRGWVLHQLAIGAIQPPKRAGNKPNSPKIYSRSELWSLKHGVDPLLVAVTQ